MGEGRGKEDMTGMMMVFLYDWEQLGLLISKARSEAKGRGGGGRV